MPRSQERSPVLIRPEDSKCGFCFAPHRAPLSRRPCRAAIPQRSCRLSCRPRACQLADQSSCRRPFAHPVTPQVEACFQASAVGRSSEGSWSVLWAVFGRAVPGQRRRRRRQAAWMRPTGTEKWISTARKASLVDVLRRRLARPNRYRQQGSTGGGRVGATSSARIARQVGCQSKQLTGGARARAARRRRPTRNRESGGC